MLSVPVNNISVMLRQFLVFPGWTSTKQQIKCLAQGLDTMTTVSLQLAILWSPVLHSTKWAPAICFWSFWTVLFCLRSYVPVNSYGHVETVNKRRTYHAQWCRCVKWNIEWYIYMYRNHNYVLWTWQTRHHRNHTNTGGIWSIASEFARI